MNAYEQHALDNSFVSVLPINSIIQNSDDFIDEVKKLSEKVDLIYLHLDLSILEQISADELGELLRKLFKQKKMACLGIAACPEIPETKLLSQANQLIESSLDGVKSRVN